MQIKIERIENQVVTCKIEDEVGGETLIDISKIYLPSDIKVGDIIDTDFEYQNIKDIPSYSIYSDNMTSKK